MKRPGIERLTIGLFLAVSVTAFETLAVATVLPTISEKFHGDRLYGATFVGYMLANLISLVTAGERADRTGLRRPFLIGALLFTAGLIVAGTAPSMWIILVGRALQGAGTGIFTTLSFVAVRRADPEPRQPRMYAVVSTAWVLPSLIAPFAAGWITDHFGWRWVFIGLIPITLLVPVLTVPALARIDADIALSDEPRRSRIPLALGIAAGIGTMTAASYTARWWLVGVLAIGGATAVVITLRRLMPRGLLRALPGRPAALAARICAMIAFNGADFFIPLAARRFHHATPTVQGAVVVGAATTWSAGQWIAVRRSKRPGPNHLVPIGFALLGFGTLTSMTVLRGSLTLWVPFWAWNIGGLGMGLLFSPTSNVAMSSASQADAGLASTQLNVSDVFGFSTMAAFGGAMVSFADQTSLHLATALAVVFLVATVVAFLGVTFGRNVRAV